MSDSAYPPPPGFPPPGQPPEPDGPTGWGSSPPGSPPPHASPPGGTSEPYAAVPGAPRGPVQYLPGAAHKPGAVPLRPLGLTDIYDAAFRIIRFNPKATVGAALLVAAVSMALPLVATAILSATSNLALDSTSDSLTGGDVAAIVGSLGSLVIGSVLQWIGSLLVTGVIVHVTLAAAVGRRLTLGEAWAATKGRRGRLVLLALAVFAAYLVPTLVYTGLWIGIVLVDTIALTIVWGIVTVPAFICLMIWIWIRFAYLPVPALMAEQIGVFAAFRRSFALTRKQFWRTFGIAVLTLIITGIAAQVLTTPISLVFSVVLTGLGPEYILLSVVVTQALTSVISAAFVTPFTGAVTSLQYLDQRMRKEAFDVELMQRAGVTAA